MEKRWSVLDALRHSRHDWLNKIQLIKGNLALNKLERVHEIIAEIVREMQHESKLTNLNASRFAEWLLTYNWEAHHVVVSYEILGDGGDLSLYDELLVTWCDAFLQQLEQQADSSGENHLDISIEIEDASVRLFFDYRGKIKDGDALAMWLDSHPPKAPIRCGEAFIHKEEMTVLLYITNE
ncbi:sporulation initiation phosphotransferase B [Anoxybacteroides amylolyticum]|uniref:Sensor kinase SpoOB-type, alpha-helical domain protein n=1 Tax=Anoxybacteroides amylolyticum TaxID=294699 RepID=A0A160F2L1_9BACL|nr:sporulation initiation phosphotransferase B [Anoxybacillus amylolyticus]ANB60141.1 sensor kinase SpoOB-type, alpha-helical domain protein [Anoxybacillus amylolyticus]